MKILGAGFGRTGTMSLKLALDQLGFGPTLHNSELWPGKVSPEMDMAWHLKANGHPVPWEKLTEGYHSAVDWPMSHYWREMSEHWPEAKVILTVRPARDWLKSFKESILPHLVRGMTAPEFQYSCARIVLGQKTFNDDLSDENLLRCYARNIVDVKSFFPEERLLVFNVKDGWGPLCRFLEVPIPDGSFPASNDGEEFRGRLVNIGDRNAA